MKKVICQWSLKWLRKTVHFLAEESFLGRLFSNLVEVPSLKYMMCLLKCLVKCEGYYTLWAILKMTYLVNANTPYIVCIEIERRDRLISTNEIYKKLKCGIFKLIWDIFGNRPPAMSILLRWIEIDMSSLYLSLLSMNICIFLKEFEPSERSCIGSVSKHGSPFVLVSRRCTGFFCNSSPTL